jgi:hypothetical protein
MPLIEEQVDPSVWMDGSTIGRAKTAFPIWIHLKDPLQFPHQNQYPLKPKAQKGLLPIINNIKQQGLLVKCSSPYNSPILQYKRIQINGGWYRTSDSSMRM